MKKLRLVESNTLTFEEGFNKYLDNCRGRNLREGTINHNNTPSSNVALLQIA